MFKIIKKVYDLFFAVSFYAIMVISMDHSFMHIGMANFISETSPLITAYALLMQIMRTAPVHLPIDFVRIFYVLPLLIYITHIICYYTKIISISNISPRSPPFAHRHLSFI